MINSLATLDSKIDIFQAIADSGLIFLSQLESKTLLRYPLTDDLHYLLFT